MAQFDDPFPTLHQIRLVVMDEIAVVHISTVIFDAQFFLDEVVERVWKHKCADLRDLTTKTQTLFAERGDERDNEVLHPFVGVAVFDNLDERLMLNVIEVF